MNPNCASTPDAIERRRLVEDDGGRTGPAIAVHELQDAHGRTLAERRSGGAGIPL